MIEFLDCERVKRNKTQPFSPNTQKLRRNQCTEIGNDHCEQANEYQNKFQTTRVCTEYFILAGNLFEIFGDHFSTWRFFLLLSRGRPVCQSYFLPISYEGKD